MANPKTLKPFKKGGDPRQYRKQKGDISWKRRFLEDYIEWCKTKRISPEKKALELFDRLDKMSLKNFPALKELVERIYGKVPDVLKLGAEEETIAKMEGLLRTLADKSNDRTGKKSKSV